jgi:hypothetical protein
MERKAEVLRTIYTSDGKLVPGTVIGEDTLATWRPENLEGLRANGHLRILESAEDGDNAELRAQVEAQAERIAELEGKLKAHDLLFDPDIHLSKNGKPVRNPGGTFRRKRGSNK